MLVHLVFICPKNSDHIMPYRLPNVFFSDRAKIFFVVLLASHNPKTTINKMHEHSNICPKLLLTPVVSFESCFFSFFSGGNCPSRVGIVRLGWELSVLGENCPYWVGIVRIGWELSVLGGNFPSWVGIVRIGWEFSVLGGNCPSWVGIVRLGWEFSV